MSRLDDERYKSELATKVWNKQNSHAPAQAPDWRQHRAELLRDLEDLKIATPLEQKKIYEHRKYFRDVVEDGTIAEHDAAIRHYQAALKGVEEEERKIINRWDVARLNTEMQFQAARIDRAAKSGNLAELQGIYDEAKQSKDAYKIRAVCEALQASVAQVPLNARDSRGNEMRRGVNVMQNTTRRDLEGLRTSPGLQAARNAAARTGDALRQASGEIYETARALDDMNFNGTVKSYKLDKELSRVKITRMGNLEVEMDKPDDEALIFETTRPDEYKISPEGMAAFLAQQRERNGTK